MNYAGDFVIAAVGILCGWTLAFAWYKPRVYQRGYFDGQNGIRYNPDGD